MTEESQTDEGWKGPSKVCSLTSWIKQLAVEQITQGLARAEFWDL